MKNPYFIKSISILAAILIYGNNSNAQIVSCNAFLQGNYIEVGVNISGAFGTSENAPTGYHPRGGSSDLYNTCASTCSVATGLGFVADPNRTGWNPSLTGTGYFGDYFLPGTPQEGWSVESNGHESDAWNQNSNGCGLSLYTSGMTGSNISYSTGATVSSTWQGMNTDGIQITQVTSLDTANVFFTMHVTLKNTTTATVNNVYYLRTVDPDNDETLTGGGFPTVNTIVYQLPNVLNATLVSATGVVYTNVWLGLGTLDCRARCFYMASSSGTLAPTVSLDTLYNELSPTVVYTGTLTQDVGIGLVFSFGNIPAGDSVTFAYAYVLKASDLTAALNSTVSTWTATGDTASSILSKDTAYVCENRLDTVSLVDTGTTTWNWISLTSGVTLSTYTGTHTTVSVNTTPVQLLAIGLGSGCAGANDTVYMTIVPRVTSVTATSNSPVCAGSPINFTGSPSATGSTYYWTGPSGFTSTSQDPTISSAVAGDAGAYRFSEVFDGCVSDTATTSVTVSTVTPAALSPATSTICPGGHETLLDATGGGVWTSSNTTIATVSGGVVTGVTTGMDTVTYAIGGCTATATVTVNATLAAITGTFTVCGDATTTLAETATGGTWSSSNTVVASVGSTGIITGGGVSVATTATITYTAGGGCTASAVVTVNPAAAAMSGSSGAVCAGLTTTFLESGSGSWSSSNTLIATVGSSTGTVTGVGTAGGTATITYTLSTGCRTTTIVTVDPLPAAIAPANPVVCIGGTITLTDATTGGYWTSNTTPIATVGATTGVAAGVSIGVDVVSYTSSSTGCSALVSLTVNASPSPITGNLTACAGTGALPDSLYDAISGGIWSSNSSDVIINSVTGIITGVSAGTSTITDSTGPGCKVTVVVTVNANPPTPTGNTFICVALPSTLSDATSGGTWSSGNTTIATVVASSGSITGVSSGSTTITYSMGSCYATSTVSVIASSPISPLTSSVCVGGTETFTEPALTLPFDGVWVSGNTTLATVSATAGIVTGISPGTDTILYEIFDAATLVCGYTATVDVTSGAGTITPYTTLSVCSGSTTALTDATSGGTWSSDNTAAATVSASGIVSGITTDTVTIFYNVGSCNTSEVVTVTASPAALSPSSATVCTGTTVSLTETTTGGTWSSSATGIATVTSGGIVSGVAAGTAIIAYTAGGCSAIAVVTVANTPAAIGPSTAVVICAASTATLTESVTGGTWSSNATGTATVSSAGVVTGVATGTATISYSSGSCFVTNTVTVNTSPAAISPSSPTVCTGTTVSLTETVTGGAWSSSATGTATVSSTGIVGGVAAGTASIAYSLGTCSASAIVTVANTPAAITPSTAVVLCAASTTTLTESVTGGTWSSNATGTATVSATGVVKGVATGTATISYISGSCFVTTTVTVSTSPAAISPSSPTVCTGTTASLTETITGGTWSSSATGTATVSSTGVVGGIAAGTATIAYSLGTCSASAIVTVANTPAAITPSTTVVFCAATTTTLAESVTGGTWSSDATGTATVSSAGVVTGVTGGTVTISYSSGSCYVTKTVTVSPGPEALLPASPTVCTGSTLSITDAVSGGTWSSSATAVATVGSTGMASGVAPGSVNISYAIGSCVATDAVTVVETPTVGAVSGTTSMCVGTTTSLMEVATDGVWSSSNTTAATVSATGTVYGAGVGTTTISYTITSSCGVIGAALVMTVNTSPSAGTITGSASMCAGATLQLSNTVTGGSWSSSNSSASVNSATGLVTGISPGTDTITYTVTTPCGTASNTKVITIGAYLSAGTITGASILCGGATTTLTDLVTGGAWSSSNSSATVGSTGIVTGTGTGGMDTISYTVTASCGSAVATDIIDVYPTAISGTMSGVSNLCIGSSATFTETATGGVWSSHNSNATVTGGGLVTAVSAGTDIISYSVSNSCGASVATVNVTISTATPTAGAITGDGSVCAGTPVILTDAVSDGVWSSSNTNASVSSTGMVTALASGLDTISYTLTTSCGTATATFVISANGTVPTAGTITGASGVCVGYPIAFTSTVSGGAWSISNSHATITAGLVSGVTSGTDTVTYTVSTSCGTAATTVAVTIGTTSAGAGSISGTSVTCAGSSTVLTDHTAGGAWSSSNTNATVIGGTVTGVTAGAAIISYSITYSCGIAYATNDITINPSSPISAITGPVTVCVGSTIALSDATPGGTWSSGNTNVTVSGGAVTGVALGTSSVSYTVTSSCGAGSAVSVITIVAGSTITLAPISGISIVCIGSGITLTDASPGGVWLASNAHAAVVGSGIIDGISPGIDTIGYLVAGVCGNVEVTKILSVDTIPTVAPIAGPASQCVGSAIALSDPTAGGIWTESTPAVGTVGLSTGVVTGVSAGTTIISYTVTNLYGCPNTVTMDDAVTPSSITTPITGSASVCLGGMTTLSNATLGGAWSSSNTAVAAIGLVTGSVTGLAPGTTTIGYTIAGSCGIATITSVETVDIFPIVSAISGSPTVCAGAATVLGDAAAGGVWSSRNTSIAVVNATSGAVTGVSGGTDEIYYLIANSCGSATDSTSITIYPGPAVDAISAAYTAVCTGNTLDISDATVGGVWVSSNTAIATVSGAGAVLGRAAGEDTIYYVVTNSRGCSSAAMVSITIGGAIVSAAVDPVGAVELCNGHTVYMHVVSSGGFTYQWLRNGIAISGAVASGYTTSATGNYSVILSNGVCSETVTGPSVIIPALPVISFTPPDKLSTGTYTSYQWFRNGVLIAGATESTIDETTGGVYTVVVTDAQGCTDTSSGYTLGATGVNSISAPQDIKVYPNPATSVVHIEAPVQVNVSVLSIDGKLLIEQNNATDVDISALADGMYMILVYDQNGLLLKTAKLAKLD